MLALRVWITAGAYGSAARLRALSLGRNSAAARDLVLGSAARKIKSPEIIWDTSVPKVPVLPEVPVETPAIENEQPAIEFVETGAEALDDLPEQVDLPDMEAPSVALLDRASDMAETDEGTDAAGEEDEAPKRKRRSSRKKPPPLKAAE